MALARAFTVTVDPVDSGAHLWLGPQSDLAVPSDGRAVVNDLPDGNHALIVRAPGYQPFSTPVTIKDGRGSAEAKLVALNGTIEIVARAGTIVIAVDARGRETPVGSVPAGGTLSSDNLLTIGSYVVRLSHPDCAPVELKNVELTPGRVVKLALAQTPLPVELRVFATQTGAEVSVNGKKLGVTPATLPGQPSETALVASANGYKPATRSFTLPANGRETWEVALEKQSFPVAGQPLSSFRDRATADDRLDNVGIRCVLAVASSP
ncbi:MAG: PEGA domain-containing protein [Opitutus sp.]|nr:PEGA domain-containing protein [Opitutus sp.]